ncbi:MAG: acyltransferase family protein [Methyloprofundus sp.]|nr:acyltransferase family protein [Methyloprofundus sp.]
MNQISRYKHIDSLRGIAVLLVIWLHVSEVYIHLSSSVKEKGIFLYDLAWYINSGRIGVIIFFSISGFVLLKSIKGEKINGTKTFLIRRFFRLYPAFWLSIILGVFVIHLKGESMDINGIIANITMLPLIFNQEMIIGVYWTLEAEILFYLMGLCLFLLGKSDKPIKLFIISMLLLIIFIPIRKLALNYPQHIGVALLPFHLSIMFWGALFRQYYDNPNLRVIILNKEVAIKSLFQVLTLAILIIPFASFIKGLVAYEFKFIQFGLSNIIGIFIFLLLTSYVRIKNKYIVWVGTISYSLYLFHPIIFMLLLYWLQNDAPAILSELHLSVYIIVNIIFSIIFSSIVYCFIEKPSINLAHHLTSYEK